MDLEGLAGKTKHDVKLLSHDAQTQVEVEVEVEVDVGSGSVLVPVLLLLLLRPMFSG